MQDRFVDIHTHKLYHDSTVYIYSYAVGSPTPPPAGIAYSAGVHPWDAGTVDMESALEYLRTAPVVAIGEVGLDYAARSDKDRQKAVLREQLAVAESRRLPVIIHSVRSYNDVIPILKEYDLPAVIFHGYIGSPELTRQIIAEGYYISFGPRSLHSPKTVESLRITPAEQLFLETDDYDEDIGSVYRSAAEVLGVPVRQLQQITNQNFNNIFG